jgi:heat shock protein HslJ
MKKEQAFFELLKAVRSARYEGAKLFLRDGGGQGAGEALPAGLGK